jgi:hypothetical protein
MSHKEADRNLVSEDLKNREILKWVVQSEEITWKNREMPSSLKVTLNIYKAALGKNDLVTHDLFKRIVEEAYISSKKTFPC